MVSSCRNSGTISQEVRYPFTGTAVQLRQESSILSYFSPADYVLWFDAYSPSVAEGVGANIVSVGFESLVYTLANKKSPSGEELFLFGAP